MDKQSRGIHAISTIGASGIAVHRTRRCGCSWVIFFSSHLCKVLVKVLLYDCCGVVLYDCFGVVLCECCGVVLGECSGVVVLCYMIAVVL